MRSRIFECRILHERFLPRRHRFVYRVFMLALDLDELGVVASRVRLLRINGRGFFCFNERDYMPTHEPVHNASASTPRPARPNASGATSLRERVAAFLKSKGVEGEVARIELITMPRVAGCCFNPVSFYYCHDADDRPLAAIAEVTNTFGEMKPYLLDRSCLKGGMFQLRVPKHFYVSPFSDVDVAFDFRLRPAADHLAVKIDDHAGGERTLRSVLTGRSRPLCDRLLLWFAVKYPLLALRVIASIHWQAMRLWAKGIPWFRKAARPGDQRDLFRPHLSRVARSQSQH